MLTPRIKLQIRILAGCQPIHEREGDEKKPITFTVGYLTDAQLTELGVTVEDCKSIPAYDGPETIWTRDGEAVHRRVHTFDIAKLEAELDTTKALAAKFVERNGALYR